MAYSNVYETLCAHYPSGQYYFMIQNTRGGGYTSAFPKV